MGGNVLVTAYVSKFYINFIFFWMLEVYTVAESQCGIVVCYSA